MRLISTHLRGRKFAFMIDETPDLQGVEQTALIVRTVNNNLEIEETFLGWHATAQKDAGSLVTLLENSLCVYQMDIEKDCLGQVLDGAATMVGRLSGVKTRIKCKYPQALFIYCAGHALNLVLQHGVVAIPACEHSMSVVGSIAKHVKRTSGWQLYQAERQRRNDEKENEQPQAEGPDGLRIYGFDGFQIHQIRNLRILEWIWKLFSNPYGFPESIQLQIPYDLYGLYHLNLNVYIKYKKFLNQPLGSINLFVYANPYGICNCIDFEIRMDLINMDYGLDLD